MEFVERSGVDNLASIRPCAYCGKPAAYRDLAGQPAHTTCAGESSEEKRTPRSTPQKVEL
jgi:hypothetical protein